METKKSKYRLIREVLSTILTVTLVVLLVSKIVLLALGIPSPIAVVSGTSMEPTLYEGDMVILYKPAPSDIKPGDVIVYVSKTGRYIIHRVIEVKVVNGEYYYRTKGDNVPIEDYIQYDNSYGISYSRVIGKVLAINNAIFKIPYIGYLSLILYR